MRNRIVKNLKTNDDVNAIVDTLSKKEKKFLGAPTDSKHKWIDHDTRIEQSQHIAKRILLKDGNTPVSMIEAWDSDYNKGPLQIAIATRAGSKYRGKGNANKLTSSMLSWFNSYGSRKYSEIQWWAHQDNIGSNLLAKKHGFKFKSTDKQKYNLYTYKK